MREASYKNYEELLLFLNAEVLANLLGVSVSSTYELMHDKDFPAIRIGSRLVVPKEKLQAWINAKTEK
ncbi:MAG: helix-turn-helix domain-containing protein [Eubacterium sp.]|nr:helix-turn-helix domain-containing protein [Eubacterium sp.]